MTEAEILELTGRELDALVAKHVLKFWWPEDRCPVCGFHFEAERGCTPGSCSMRPRPYPTSYELYVPHYSTDLRDAFTLERDDWEWGFLDLNSGGLRVTLWRHAKVPIFLVVYAEQRSERYCLGVSRAALLAAIRDT